jgi:hypothetical protein
MKLSSVKICHSCKRWLSLGTAEARKLGWANTLTGWRCGTCANSCCTHDWEAFKTIRFSGYACHDCGATMQAVR